MQSEIPQLEVVTAISEAESEDFLSQLLFSQGWSIIYRAFDMAGLVEFLTERNGALRTVVVYKSDLPDFDLDVINTFENSKVTPISIDGIEINSHKLMTHIRGQLRMPLIYKAPIVEESLSSKSVSKERSEKPQVITLTGTVGAPGRSSIALNLANYLAENMKVVIFDADVRAPALEYLMGRAEDTNPMLSLLDVTISENRESLIIPDLNQVSIVDLGALPPLDEVVNDRRWQANFINKTLEDTTTLIYLCKSSGLSLIRLEKFMSQFPLLLRKLPIIYLLNQSGGSREERALANRFSKMCAGEKHLILPKFEELNVTLAQPSKRESAFSKAISEIGRICLEAS